MIVAIVIAGGVGKRMGHQVPKQFLNVNDKPIIIHTLDAFQQHPQIDAIEVVCLEGWEGVLEAYAKQYGISKLRWITQGGNSGQESIRNGINNLSSELNDDDYVLIHDGVRPIVDSDVISDVIRVTKEHGCGVSSMPYYEQIFLTDPNDATSTLEFIPRDQIRRVSTPQGYNYTLVRDKYEEAFSRGIGIGPNDYTNTMMVQLGVRLYFAAGSDRNIKLTTPENLEYFRAHLSQLD